MPRDPSMAEHYRQEYQAKYTRKDFALGCECLMTDPDKRSVTVFCGDLSDVKQRVRMTRNSKNSFVVTYGRPNYAERAFLKLCKRAKTKPRKTWFQYFKKKK